MSDDLGTALASTLQDSRRARGLTAAALADLSGVSRAMIGKIERGQAQPTAVLLGRLSTALGITLSELVARAEDEDRRLVRVHEQPTLTDPASGFRRRAVSPAPGGPLELVEVDLHPGAEIAYPAESYTYVHQQIWVLDGRLALREGPVVHDLGPGDCLQLGPPEPCVFHNATDAPCRYLVAITRRRA